MLVSALIVVSVVRKATTKTGYLVCGEKEGGIVVVSHSFVSNNGQ